MKIIRVSTLEKFRRFRDSVSESWDTEQSVVDAISGRFTGNELTQIGTAFHKIVEDASYNLTQTKELIFSQFGVTFNDAQVQMAIDHALEQMPFIPEIRMYKRYSTMFGDLMVTGCTDVLQGTTLRDTKTKFSQAEYCHYFDSYQWRLYLDIFNLDRFVYDVFVFSGHDGMDVSNYSVKKCDPFECLRYEAMQDDINKLINDFVAWIDFRALWHHLEDWG